MKFTIQKSPSIDQLVIGCKDQRPQAQKEVYNRFSPKMLGVCLRYVKDQPEAEGVMVKSFFKVFNKIDQFKADGSFEGWIRRIMVNESLIYLRKNKSMYLEVDIESAEREPDYGSLNNNLEVEDLMKLINNLPVGYRTVFNLYAIEGFSHKEIASQLGINENTSKSQLSRARTLLQKQLLNLDKQVEQKFASHE